MMNKQTILVVLILACILVGTTSAIASNILHIAKPSVTTVIFEEPNCRVDDVAFAYDYATGTYLVATVKIHNYGTVSVTGGLVAIFVLDNQNGILTRGETNFASIEPGTTINVNVVFLPWAAGKTVADASKAIITVEEAI